MALFTIIWLLSITNDYSNRPLYDIRNWRCSMHRCRSLISILIVYAYPFSTYNNIYDYYKNSPIRQLFVYEPIKYSLWRWISKRDPTSPKFAPNPFPMPHPNSHLTHTALHHLTPNSTTVHHYPTCTHPHTLGLPPILDPFLCHNSVLLSVAHSCCLYIEKTDFFYLGTQGTI